MGKKDKDIPQLKREARRKGEQNTTVKDLPAYLAFLNRQAALGRTRIYCDGEFLHPKMAIAHILEKFPWLSE